jgi:hypothetical protein
MSLKKQQYKLASARFPWVVRDRMAGISSLMSEQT